MAKIPRFFNTRPVKAGTVGVQISPERQGALSRTGLEGKNMIEAGNRLIDIGKADTARRESSYMNNDLTNFQLDAAKQYDIMSADAHNNPSGFNTRYKEWYQENAEKVLSRAPSTKAQETMGNRLLKLGGSYDLRGIKRERSLMVNQNMQQTDATANRLINTLQQQPHEFEAISSQLNSLANSLGAQGVSSSSIDTTKRKLNNLAQVATLQGRMKLEPTKVLEEIGTGAYNDLKPNQLKELTKQASEISTMDTLKSVYLGGHNLDPTNVEHKKAADAVLDDLLTSMKDGDGKLKVSQEEFMANILTFTKQGKGLLAPKLKSMIESSIQSGNSEAKGMYSRLVTAMDKDPNTRPALSGISDNTIQEAVQITRMTESGTPLEQAVELARNEVRAPASQDLITKRRNEVKALIKDDDVSEAVEDHFNGYFSSAPGNIGVAVEQYKRIYRTFYDKNGDADMSKELTLKKLETTYAATDINGTRELMENAPSLVFPGKEDEFKQALQSHIKESFETKTESNIFSADVTKPIINGKVRDIRIKSILSTNRDGGYGMFYTETLPDGTLVDVPVLHPVTGLPSKFIFIPSKDKELAQKMTSLSNLREIQNKQFKENTFDEKHILGLLDNTETLNPFSQGVD